MVPRKGDAAESGNKTGLLCRVCVRRLPVNITGGNVKYRRCTILRTFVRGTIEVGLVTGKVTILDNWIETVRCGETLWCEERDRGVCARCARGHEDEHSTFANDAERDRAMGGQA